jgi:hypothetical protein
VRNVNTSAGAAYFTGVITDVSRKFAMPYNSGTGAAPQDRITITATGPTGQLGKAAVTDYVVTNRNANVEIILAAGRHNVIAEPLATTSLSSSAQTFTGGVLDLINTLLRTIQFIIDDIDAQRSVVSGSFITAFYPIGNASSLTFSDAGTVGALKFSDLEYLSSVQNTFTEVEVVPAGLATQSATSGAAPYNTLVYDTFSESTSDALNLAEFILATQSLVQVTPFSIATNTNIAPTCLGFAELNTRSKLVPLTGVQVLGSLITVIFRGTTVTAQIQGINTTFYPEYAAVQLYLSPSLGAPFTLDSTILGVLDQNKLGF